MCHIAVGSSHRFPAHCENLSPQVGADSEIESEAEQQWTKVTSKRSRRSRARLPPCYPVPVHLCDKLHTPNVATSEGSDDDHLPQLTMQEAEPTAVAARTRSKLKNGPYSSMTSCVRRVVKSVR